MRYLAPYNKAGIYQGSFYPEKFLDEYGGICVVPHPYLILSEEQWREAITGTYRVIDGQHTYYEPMQDIESARELQWNEIKAERDRLEQAGVPYLGKILDSDTVSVQRIAIAVQAAQSAIAAGQTSTLSWTCADNTTLTMTAEQVCGMSVALAQYSDQLHQIARGLREQIEAATTVEELDIITWPR